MTRDEKRSGRVSGGLRPCVDEIVGPYLPRRPSVCVRDGRGVEAYRLEYRQER